MIAARLEGLAEPGGICISAQVLDQVRRKLELGFEDLGEQTVKNIPDPVHAYRLSERAAQPQEKLRRLGRWVAAAGVIAAGLVALLVSWPPPKPPALQGDGETTPGVAPLTSIAVLPFDDMSPAGDQKWLANGMAEDLTEALSRIKELRVIGRTSSTIAKESGADLAGIGELLDVGAIVEGSVRRSEDQILVTAQFIRVADESHLWSGRYDRKLEDVFAVQQEVARDVAEAIRTELGLRTTMRWLERARYEPRDIRAYELVRRGWELLYTPGREQVLQGGELFREAITIDPDYVAAHNGIAWHHFFLWELGLVERKQLALEAANRVKQMDPTQYGLHQMQARLSWAQFDFEDAERFLAPAVEAHPEDDGLRNYYGSVLLDTGRFDEACAQRRKGVELEPLHPWSHYLLAQCDLARKDYAKATERLEHALTLDARIPLAAGNLGLAYHLSGRDPEALEAYLRIPAVDAELESALRRGFDQSGWAGLNRVLIQSLAERLGRPCLPEPAIGAHLYARAGEEDPMYMCLERAIEQRGNYVLGLIWHPSWHPYREDPRFQAILNRVGLAD
jgi:adenylate cyclase